MGWVTWHMQNIHTQKFCSYTATFQKWGTWQKLFFQTMLDDIQLVNHNTHSIVVLTLHAVQNYHSQPRAQLRTGWSLASLPSQLKSSCIYIISSINTCQSQHERLNRCRPNVRRERLVNQQTRRQAAADLLLVYLLWYWRSNWPQLMLHISVSRKCETLTQFCPINVESQQSPGKFPDLGRSYNLLKYLQWTRSTYVVEARKWCWHGPPHCLS